MKKLIFITALFLTYSLSLFADDVHFIDYTKVLNNSKPGAAAQKMLQEKFQTASKKFDKSAENIRQEESEIISQKKVLSAEDYKKKVKSLREKDANLQKNKKDSFNNIAKSRNQKKQALLKAVNPIVKKYMEDNKIRIVIDKKTVVMGDKSLEITDKIISILNKEVPSLKSN